MVTLADTLKDLQAEYDYVAIIDCLPPSQRVVYGLSHSLMDVLHSLSYEFTTFPCDTVAGLRRALATIQMRAEAGHPAVLVVICHGDEREIGVGDAAERMPWIELARLWEPINTAMSGTLLVLMSTCAGINAIQESATTMGEPFFGLIGTKEKLPVKTAREINEALFTGLRNGISIGSFIEASNNRWGDNFVRGITSEFWRARKGGTLSLP